MLYAWVILKSCAFVMMLYHVYDWVHVNLVGFKHDIVCLSDFKVVYFSVNVVSCVCLSDKVVCFCDDAVCLSDMMLQVYI